MASTELLVLQIRSRCICLSTIDPTIDPIRSHFSSNYNLDATDPTINIHFVNGQVKRTPDEDIQSNILEIVGSNVQSTYITLGIKLPFLVMIVKNMKKYFTFEIQVLDDKNVRRRFRASNFQVCFFLRYWMLLQSSFDIIFFSEKR
ncbi:hypothetical protein L2E82_06725 [Cichorium intybus]|uniref:Uncharacterized protein n=1 Tax=Cichorium intybus TaxID=13427 RepID=A0ACB9HAB9_CICIN|nr:hypothetical protein L2E82_06725 [Cichorium intybus]